MQNIASAFFSSKNRQKSTKWEFFNFAMNNSGVIYLYWSHLDQYLSPWRSWLNEKYAASGVMFFILV